MSRRHILVGMLSATLLLALSGQATAGGWAVVRLDAEPGEVHEATPWRFGFMVLQHDVTPNSDVTPVMRALHTQTGEEIKVTGVQEGPVGHFVAEATFPRAGDWKWSIEPLPYAETSFATLTVLASRDARPWPMSPWGRYWLSSGPLVDHLEYAAEPGITPTIAIQEPWIFAPSSLDIAVGATVTWVNRTDTTHTVTGDDLAFDDSGPIASGEAFSTTFEHPGTYPYRCGPHPDMVGEIVVT